MGVGPLVALKLGMHAVPLNLRRSFSGGMGGSTRCGVCTYWPFHSSRGVVLLQGVVGNQIPAEFWAITDVSQLEPPLLVPD